MCLGALGALDRSTTSADVLALSTPDDDAARVVVVVHRRAISRVVRRSMSRDRGHGVRASRSVETFRFDSVGTLYARERGDGATKNAERDRNDGDIHVMYI